jgi:hypothetical protein
LTNAMRTRCFTYLFVGESIKTLLDIKQVLVEEREDVWGI